MFSPLSYLFLKKNVFYVYWYFACICVYVPYVSNVCGSQKKALDPLKLELETVTSCHWSTRN